MSVTCFIAWVILHKMKKKSEKKAGVKAENSDKESDSAAVMEEGELEEYLKVSQVQNVEPLYFDKLVKRPFEVVAAFLSFPFFLAKVNCRYVFILFLVVLRFS